VLSLALAAGHKPVCVLKLPKAGENSRKFSPAFSRNMKASVLRTLARKQLKHGRNLNLMEDV
jgi:hypothetical protein